MSPWRWQWWRLAWTDWRDRSSGEINTYPAKWRRVVFGLWWRVG